MTPLINKTAWKSSTINLAEESMSETSIPGPGNDPLEADFEKQLQDEGLELEGRKAPEKKPDAPAPAKEPESPEKDPKEPAKEPEKEKDPKDPKDPKDKKGDEPEKGTEEWRIMIAKRRQEKARSDGKEKSEPVKPDPSKPEQKPEPKPDAKATELSPEQKEFAEKYGIEPEDMAKAFPPAKVEKIAAEGISPEDRALLDQYKNERDSLLIDKGYTADFDTNVLPLLKEEYPGISDAKIAEVRQQIREKLETETYGLTPLDVIYRGDKAFRGLVAPKNDGVDQGNRVPAKTGSKVYDFETVTEEDIKKPDFPFSEYSEYMAKREKKK